MHARLPLLTALLVLALPGLATAATARSETTCLPTVKGVVQGCYTVAQFTGVGTEANDVTVTQTVPGPVPGARFRFHDANNPIEAGEGCAVVDANTVECDGGGGGAETRTNAGDDRVTGAGSAYGGTGADALTVAGSAFGEEGDDVLDGGPAGEYLYGGDGNDRLIGLGGADRLAPGPGADTVEAGDGDDIIVAADVSGPAPDVIAAGPGEDDVSYTEEPAGIEIDLATGATSGGAQGDTLTGVENVEGSRGPTRLSGDDGPNRLEGFTGAVVLDGRGGDDELKGSDGADTIDGGLGADRIDGEGGLDRLIGGEGEDFLYKTGGSGRLEGGPGDDLLSLSGAKAGLRLVCGDGVDVVSPAGRARIGADCESLSIGDMLVGLIALPLRVQGSFVNTTLQERRGEVGRIRVRDARTNRVLGSARYRGAGMSVSVPVRIRLSAKAVRRFRAAGRLAVILDVKDATPAIDRDRYRVTLVP